MHYCQILLFYPRPGLEPTTFGSPILDSVISVYCIIFSSQWIEVIFFLDSDTLIVIVELLTFFCCVQFKYLLLCSIHPFINFFQFLINDYKFWTCKNF